LPRGVLVKGATALGQPLPKCCTFHQMIPYPRSRVFCS
jgi:hypothetical protein